MKIFRFYLLLLILLSPSILYSQIRLIAEIDGVALDTLRNSATMNNRKIYFQKKGFKGILISENGEKIAKVKSMDIIPNGQEHYYIQPYTSLLVNSDNIAIGDVHWGVLHFDGEKWNNYNRKNSDITKTEVFGMAANGKGEYIFLNKTGPNKIGYLKDGTVEIREFEIVGDQVEYFYPGIPMGYFNGNYYYVASTKQLCKIDGDKIITTDILDYYSNGDGSIMPERFHVHDDYLWFVTGETNEQDESIIYIVRYDGEKYERLDFFLERFNQDELKGAFNTYEFDRDGNMWMIMSTKNEAKLHDYTLLIYNKEFELIYDRSLKEYEEVGQISKILVDKSPGGIRETYILGQNGIIAVDPDITSVEETEARGSLHFQSITPNPVQTTARVEFLATHKSIESVKFRLTDYLGREVEILQPEVSYDRISGKATAQLDVSGVQRGYYYLLIQSNEYTVGKAVVVE
jgi:type IX secretion system substrate protein